MSDTRSKVQAKLKALASQNTRMAATELFSALGYASRKTVDLDGAPASFLKFVDSDGRLAAKTEAKLDKWQRVDFLFQLTNDELPILAQGTPDMFAGQQDYRTSIIESFVFLAIELADEEWGRGALAGITREVNRLFPMPAVILFKHGGMASLAVIDRRPNKKDGSRDVVEKRISIVKDINLASPHRAHVDILCDIALSAVKVRGRGTPTNFRDLYDGWIEALSAQTLNTRFYRELANWFLWSTKIVEFPAAVRARENETTDKAKKEAFEAQNQIAVIRLLTRLIFVWFIKEKGLVPEALFDAAELKALLNEEPATDRESSTYYQAVLQNLFFATLNTEMSEDRKWRTKGSGGGLDGQYLIHTVYRFRDAFRDPDKALGLFKQVPFLNGGLFECLDREVSARDLERNPDLKKRLVKEGSRDVIRIDGFSERPDNPLKVPNKIFFATKEKVDLNKEYDTKGKTYEADGLIELFSRYKFTVEENTPVEEEVALDPELLGKVFENLLASYNADTRTTARKKSGSFYTPREVVDYMVDEALIASFERRLAASSTDLGARLRNLLSFKESGNPFSNAETDQLIAAIDGLRALDPACGSGAFPMGLLQKLIHVLHRLDPDNSRWRAQLELPYRKRIREANTLDPDRREAELEDADMALKKLDRDFSDANKPDYARKLYLIDKCLFGVDIQPIAVQIAKLRFFISLVVSQKIDPNNPDNRNITALPNLETKLVAANSLIPIERKAQADLFRNTKIAEKEAELRAMNARYFSARTAKTKRLRREDIAGLRDELAELLKSDRGLPETDAKLMAAWDPFDQNAAAPFFDPEWMFGLSARFDLVIGNPPYISAGMIKEQKPDLKAAYGTFYDGNADLFTYFYKRGFELLANGGVLVYISSNKFMRTGYGLKTRQLLARQNELRTIVDFGELPVFGASVDSAIVVCNSPESEKKRAGKFRAVTVKEKDDIPLVEHVIRDHGMDFEITELSDEGWLFESGAVRNLMKRIKSSDRRLNQIVRNHFYRGILTGFNDAFLLSEGEAKALIEKCPEARDFILPWLDGAEILRWKYDYSGQYLLAIASSANKAWPWSHEKSERAAEEAFSSAFPVIFQHLVGNRDRLSDRTDKGQFWWELRSCSYWDAFSQKKLVFNETSKEMHAFVDDKALCINKTGFIITHDEVDFLCGALNSSVLDYYYRQTFPTWGDPWKGGRIQFRRDRMVDVPIPWPEKHIREQVATLVRAVSEIARSAELSSNRFEQLLNGFVYELFFKDDLHARGLTLFDEAERAGLGSLAGLEGAPLVKAAESFAATHLVPGARLRTMLSDLATLDVVRIIEGRE